MKVLINFASKNFEKEQKFNSKTGLKKGGFDKVIEYSTNDIDVEFYTKNKIILDNTKGGGLWLWKPYIIQKTLDQINYGDYLFYCDSGSFFVNSIDNLIKCLERDQKDVMGFECQLLNIQYTKAEFFEIIKEDLSEWLYKNQTIGTFLLVKKTEQSLKIIKEFLFYCENKELLTDPDSKNQSHLFVAHRHDQSILSYVLWKNGITNYRDPSQFGKLKLGYINYALHNIGISYGCFKTYKTSSYPTIVIQYRKDKLYKWVHRNVFLIKHSIKSFLIKLVI